MKDFGLYIVVTNPLLDYRIFCETCVAEEVPMLQLREKHLSDGELLRLSRLIKDITNNTNTRFIINDRPDIAALINADGLHLGQDDLPINAAKQIVTNDTLIGISTHNISQALTLINNINKGIKPDYMSFGPIYPTTAKTKPDPAVGTDLLKQVIDLAPIPVVTIGGIFPHNLEEVMKSGAKNIAMIRYFSTSKDVSELRDRIRTIQTRLKENQK